MPYKRFFCSRSGEDYSIIKECPPSLVNLFVAIGAFVLFVFVTCFFSFAVLFSSIFDLYFFSIVLAFFFAWMVTNIYLLILYTLSISPNKSNTKLGHNILSNLTKYGFIVFISILVTKPLEVFLFSNELAGDMTVFRTEQLDKYRALTNKYFDQETKLIRELLQEQKDKQFTPEYNATQVSEYETILAQNNTREKELTEKMGTLIYKSDFFTQKIIFLCTKHPKSWWVSLFILGIFLLPAVLKSLVSSQSTFSKLKKEIETRIVREEYEWFTARYNTVLRDKFGSNYSWVELYDDPPFNFSRKEEYVSISTEEDFIQSVYHD